jgi:hypothetical protein
MNKTIFEHVRETWGGDRCKATLVCVLDPPLVTTTHGINKQMLWAAASGLAYGVVAFWDPRAGYLQARSVNFTTGELLS